MIDDDLPSANDGSGTHHRGGTDELFVRKNENVLESENLHRG